MKVYINKKKCKKCHLCVTLYPECFEVDFDNTAVAKKLEFELKDREMAQQASNNCPTKALLIFDS